MGMFDNIHVKENKINLPLPENGYYQTKDLDSNLCEIQIDADGLMTCPDYKGCQNLERDIEIDNRRLRVTMYGKLKDDSIMIDETVIHELKAPYLRKGFKKLVGFFLYAQVTNA